MKNKTLVKCPLCYSQFVVDTGNRTIFCKCSYGDNIENFIPRHFIGDLTREKEYNRKAIQSLELGKK